MHGFKLRTVIRVLAGIAIAANLALAGGLLTDWQSLWENYEAGCLFAPKDVEFKQGMTLCPGQSAHGVVTFTLPAGPAVRRSGDDSL